MLQCYNYHFEDVKYALKLTGIVAPSPNIGVTHFDGLV